MISFWFIHEVRKNIGDTLDVRSSLLCKKYNAPNSLLWTIALALFACGLVFFQILSYVRLVFLLVCKQFFEASARILWGLI